MWKVCIAKTMVFPVVMYGHDNWTIKKAECWRIDAFELWHWRRLLRVPWTVRRSNQSILKEINLEYSLEGLMLKLQYFGHMIWRANSLEKTLMLGKIEGRKIKGQRRIKWLDGISDSMDMSLSSPCDWWWIGKPGILQSTGSQRVRHNWATELNWTELIVFPVVMYTCESWIIKKAERQRIDAFELGCWRRLLRVPWTARRSNQLILREINPEYSLEGLMLKPKLQYSGHLMRTHW